MAIISKPDNVIPCPGKFWLPNSLADDGDGPVPSIPLHLDKLVNHLQDGAGGGGAAMLWPVVVAQLSHHKSSLLSLCGLLGLKD